MIAVNKIAVMYRGAAVRAGGPRVGGSPRVLDRSSHTRVRYTVRKIAIEFGWNCNRWKLLSLYCILTGRGPDKYLARSH